MRYPLLLLDRGSNTRSYIDSRLDQVAGQARVVMELGSIEVIKRLVMEDFGMSIVPRLSVEEERRQGRLNVLHVFKKSECRMLGLVHPAGGLYARAAQVFVDMLQQHLAGQGML